MSKKARGLVWGVRCWLVSLICRSSMRRNRIKPRAVLHPYGVLSGLKGLWLALTWHGELRIIANRYSCQFAYPGNVVIGTEWSLDGAAA